MKEIEKAAKELLDTYLDGVGVYNNLVRQQAHRAFQEKKYDANQLEQIVLRARLFS
jgi:hypothetical protein